jgi:YidC/Oxa1 family membrane protein insertase
MNADNRNLIAAIAISMMILIVYQIYFVSSEEPQLNTASPEEVLAPALQSTDSSNFGESPESAQETAARVKINAPALGGSISLAGGRIDELLLLSYGEEVANDEQRVQLLRQTGGDDSYFAEVLFLDPEGKRMVAKDAVWETSARNLTPDQPLTLTHRRDDGMKFSLTYTIDNQYLISIAAEAVNASGTTVDIRHFARIRRNLPSVSDFFISYEGPIGVFAEDEKTEIDYDDVQDLGPTGEMYKAENIKGWIGITDKYWLTAFIPDDQEDLGFGFRRPSGGGEPAQVDAGNTPVTLADGGSLRRVFHLYAGPKKVNVLLDYNESLGVERLDHAIDWGWFPFLTKPFFHGLNWFYGILGNFGLAIMALTVVVKLAFFPLANKSYHSMAKMRELTPKIQELRERFGDDKQRLQQEMMQLYRNEKVNPAAGCLPILLQIPVFFALYKVLFVTIEMRHAPFYGWVEDLSALDPTSVLNLFGLLPYTTEWAPDFINLGIWPILMGVTMFIQMSLNPPPPDPIQAKVFKFMPIMFTFLLATFPAGLVIYWTWNNLLSIIQQMYIMRSVKKAMAKKD